MHRSFPFAEANNRIGAQNEGKAAFTFLLFLCSIPAAFFLFELVYGVPWAARFQRKVPTGTMSAVQRAVGSPIRCWTNVDRSVTWDYTRWWSLPARVHFGTNGIVSRVFTE